MSTTARVLKGLGSFILLTALVVGLPIALWTWGGNPIPTSLPSWDQIVTALTSVDDGRVFLGALRVVGWLGWAVFAISVIVELPAQLRGVRAPRLRGLGLPQRAAAVLVAAMLALLLSPATSSHAATGPTEVSAPVSAAVVQTIETPAQVGPVVTEQDETSPTVDDEQLAAPTYEVQAGDSLWAIAQTHLGDGNRWTEIRDLNVGVTQPDGYSLQQGVEWIEPGWTLTLPDDATIEGSAAAATEEADAGSYTVQAGDTLSEISETQLGDADRYPEIFQASAGTDHGGGVHLTDPDVIDVGWELTIPGESAADAEAPAEQAAPQPAPDEVEPEAPEPAHEPSTAPQSPEAATTAPEAVQEPSAAPQSPDVATTAPEATQSPYDGEAGDGQDEAPADDVDDTADEEAAPAVRTIGGVGALLAAGILGILAVRRQRSNRTRPPGTRLAMPEPGTPASAVEAELRAVADPIGLETVDQALRGIAAWCAREQLALPQVRAARLTNDGAEFWLYLDEPADLPAPWSGSPDHRVWVLRASDVDEADLADSHDDTPAPWPSLVTLGHDEEDAHLLLDLERVGHLDIRGDGEAAHGTLAALAVELATSRWADDLQVTLVGTLPGLPDVIDTSRIRYVSGLHAVLQELQVRAEQLRADGTTRLEAPLAWTPEILIIGTELDEQARSNLDDLVAQLPRVGIAALTNDGAAGEWALDLDPEDTSEGVLNPTEIRVRPQQISPAEYAQILSVLTGANEYVPGPTWTEHLATAEPTLEDLPAAVDESAAAATAAGEDEDLTNEVVDVILDDLTITIPEPAPVQPLHTPLIRVLGEIDVAGVDTSTISHTHLPQATELITYLALHPGVDTDQLSRDIWPPRRKRDASGDYVEVSVSLNTRNSSVSRARKLLGTNEDGEPYLAVTTSLATGNPYELRAVRTDWDLFNELRGQDPSQTSLEDLRKALALVRGEPFSKTRDGRTRVRSNRYLWANPWIQEMTCSILDVARETAHRALLEGKPRLASEAAAAGLRAGTHDERVWRYAIRAATQLGDSNRVDQLVTDLTDTLTDLDVDPQPETNDLLDQLATTTARPHAS